MRGLTFKSKETIDNHDFIKMFNGMDSCDHKIKFGYQEFYYSNDGYPFEMKEIMGWEEFIKILHRNELYTIFLEMFVCPKECEEIELPIDYNHYLNSEFEAALFIYDSAYLDFYAKNDEITKKVMENISNDKYEKQEYTFDHNDYRTGFRVW